jgi:ADP-L-glycero-D-manno-heptose 6-epimerase
MKIILTGGAGFIGSCVLRCLNDIGVNNVIVVDNIASTEKWRNLVNKKYLEYIHKDHFFNQINNLKNITHIIHIGACSATTERNFDYLYTNNVSYTKWLWNFCTEQKISFIYASSAATYGAGEQGFSDENDLKNLMPLNGYGYSKQLFDVWAESQIQFPKQYVGLKFFNVYGPNEYHKGTMASVIYHSFKQIKDSGKIKLFKSYNPNYADGGQLRDFVYVKDVCAVIKFFIEHPEKNGLYNVGSGVTESFAALGKSVFKALNIQENIEYIDMPEHLKDKYQYHTKATMNKLHNIGYKDKFTTLENGVMDYVRNYLAEDFKVW